MTNEERSPVPPCPTEGCTQPHVVRNGSSKGRARYQCRSCRRYFGETEGTPLYRLQTPVAEIAQAVLMVMRRGSLRGAEEVTGHKYETIRTWLYRAADHAAHLSAALEQDLHLSTVEIDEFWSFVRKKTHVPTKRTPGSGGADSSKSGRVASSSLPSADALAPHW